MLTFLLTISDPGDNSPDALPETIQELLAEEDIHGSVSPYTPPSSGSGQPFPNLFSQNPFGPSQ